MLLFISNYHSWKIVVNIMYRSWHVLLPGMIPDSTAAKFCEWQSKIIDFFFYLDFVWSVKVMSMLMVMFDKLLLYMII